MDANVLLFRLNHPDTLAAHLVNHSKDVDVILALEANQTDDTG